MALNLKGLREEYSRSVLDVTSAATTAYDQFEKWFSEAQEVCTGEVNAMTLATMSSEGFPRTRIVLLKQFDKRGFVFFTNYASEKGRELALHPQASLNFWWPELQRQVRIEGLVSKVPVEESTNYFQSRPRDSQVGAWTSPQSQPIPDRDFLEKRFAEMQDRFKGEAVLPRPKHWGGYVLEPSMLEFWQGRPSRLHDRLRYQKQDDGRWAITRLAP